AAAVAGGATTHHGAREARAEYLGARNDVPGRAGSVRVACAELGVPVTVHAAIGAEIIHQHPSADGAALGATSHRDFKRLAGALPDLDGGGVVLNLGSAVVMPEVFLKALTVARNLNGGRPKNFTACDCDMQRHYRPRVNVVERPTLAGGRGIQLTGHHEILLPLLAWSVLSRFAGITSTTGGRVTITAATANVEGRFAWVLVDYSWLNPTERGEEAGRATFICERRGENWKIAHAHSSQPLPWEP